MKFIVSGLYAKAKREGFSVKEICSKHHYRYKDAEGKKLYDKYRIDYISDGGRKEKHISQGVEKDGYIRKFRQGELPVLHCHVWRFPAVPGRGKGVHTRGRKVR